MKLVFQEWRDKLFRFTHALILPLSTLVIASLILGISNILINANIKHQLVISLHDIGQSLIDYIPLLFGAALVFYFVKLNKVYALFAYVLALGIFFGTQNALIKVDEEGNVFDVFNLHQTEYFKFFVIKHWKFITLNTSYFGAFIVAMITIWIVNHCSDFELNQWFSLINKEKFVPIILIPAVLLISILIVVIWPYLGQSLSWLLTKTTNLDYGFDMFFYGMLTALLKPFGFNYVFSSLVLETSVGGNLNIIKITNVFLDLDIVKKDEIKKLIKFFYQFTKNKEFIIGQKNILNFINSLNLNKLPINKTGENIPILNWFNNYLDINIGQFTQDYSVIFGVYAGIGGTLIIFAPKEKRKQLMLTIIPTLIVSVITGIDEPFIFILLFATPLLYFILYVPLMGSSLMFMKMFDAHILGGINQGLIDFINYGIMSFAKGTNFWVVFPIAAIEGFISFFCIYFFTRQFKWNKIFHSDYTAIYISKKQYNHLVSIGFKNQTKPNQNEFSIKKQIQNYIVENIKTQKWKIGEILPSEQALAIKFNCSRLTARNALLKYVNSGILSTKRGQGYFVNNNHPNVFNDGNNQISQYKTQSLKIISPENIDFISSWIDHKNYDFTNLNLTKTYNLEKKYFDNNGNLMIYEISILNKNEIFLVNNGTIIDESLLKHLNLQHKNLTQNYSQVIFSKNSKYQLIAKELGWENEYPIIVTLLNKDDNWLEISIKIISKNDWEFCRDYKIID